MSSFSVYFSSCQSLSALGIALLVVSLCTIIANSFPMYALLMRTTTSEMESGNNALYMELCRSLLLCLVSVEMCCAMFAVPLYMLGELSNAGCERNSMVYGLFQGMTRYEHFCGAIYACYFGLKLAELFLITLTSCTTYLQISRSHAPMQSRRECVVVKTESAAQSDREVGTDSTTTSSDKVDTAYNSAENLPISSGDRFDLFSIILVGVFLLSALIGSLPLAGLGPLHCSRSKQNNLTMESMHRIPEHDSKSIRADRFCQIESFSRPLHEKEYIFVVAVLMTSCGCILLLIYATLMGCRHKANPDRRLAADMMRLASIQTYFSACTWLPVMLLICAAMSGFTASRETQSHVVFLSFFNALAQPVLLYCCVRKHGGAKTGEMRKEKSEKGFLCIAA